MTDGRAAPVRDDANGVLEVGRVSLGLVVLVAYAEGQHRARVSEIFLQPAR